MIKRDAAVAEKSLAGLDRLAAWVVFHDRHLVAYPLLMVAAGYAISYAMTLLYSYQGGHYLVLVLGALNLVNLVAQHKLLFFISFSVLTQILVALSSTYMNIAMLLDMRAFISDGRSSFMHSVSAARRYVPAIAIWVPMLYIIITYLEISPAYYAGLDIPMTTIYIPASIPLLYLLLVLMDKNYGPVRVTDMVLRKAGAALASARDAVSPWSSANILLLIMIFILSNGLLLVSNFALTATAVTDYYHTLANIAVVLVSIVTINIIGLVSYDYFQAGLVYTKCDIGSTRFRRGTSKPGPAG